jgi:hypothetical protein
VEDMNMQKMMNGKRVSVITGLLALWVSLFFIDLSLAQDKPETSPCPTPYIKIIKPKLAQPGQEIIIRGRRFGEDEESGDVIFPPGLSGRIIYWRNNRIRVEVPPGAQTGEIVVKTKCATSNNEFLKVGNETSKDESGGTKKPALE